MGGCLGSSHDSSNARTDMNPEIGSMPIGRNQPLKPESPKWKSDIPLTKGQLKSKRDEFWETAPAFEGRKEIWDALRGAAQELENGEHALAQAIVDGANITCPNGTLTDCYDELGNRYVLPVYCLSPPINLVEESIESEVIDPEPVSDGVEMSIKLRLSTGKDIKMVVRSTDTVFQIKKRLLKEEGVDPSQQRWYFSGKLLPNKTRIEDANIPKGFIIQVIISQPEPPPPVDG